MAATQALKEGQTVTQSYSARVTDDFGAYLDQSVTVTISGTNDVPVVTNGAAALAGTVVEAGNNDDGSAFAGTSSISGVLSASDVDSGATRTWSIIGMPSTTYGAIAIDASTGMWTYSLDNTNASTQALNEGQSVSETFTARVTDDFGAYVDQTITVTINGTNDVPVVTSTAAARAGTVVEAGQNVNGSTFAGTSSISGTLNASDVDGSATRTWSIPGTPSTTYGTIAIDASTGVWTYTLDNTKTATQAIAKGQSVTETLTARVTDDFGAYVDQTITVTINGTDDLPLTTAQLLDATVKKARAGLPATSSQGVGAAFASLQDPEGNSFTTTVTAARTADGSFAPVPLSSSSSSGLVLEGNYGSITIKADGSYTYTLNNSNASVMALRGDQTLDDSFLLALTTSQVESLSTYKNVIEQPLVIRINGGNSSPISGGVISAGPALEAGVVAGGNTAVVSTNLTGSTGALFTQLTDAENDSFLVTGGRHSSQSTNSASVALGAGLKVELFEGIGFTGMLRSTRTESTINFNDGYDTRDGGNGDTYSLRCTGQIQAYANGTNTFNVGSDDGVRVWVNGSQVVDSWRDRGTAYDTFNVPGLTQGEWYDIKIEFYENSGGSALLLQNANNTFVTALRSVQTNAIAGTYGNLTLDQAGGYSYTLKQTAANVQALQNGTTVNDTFYVTVSDGQGGTVEQQLNL